MTTTTAARLRAAKEAAWEQAKAIAEPAIAEGRDLTPAEQAKFDALEAEIDGLAARELTAQRAERADATRELDLAGLSDQRPGELRELLASGRTSAVFNVARPLDRFSISNSADAASLHSNDFADRVAMYLRTVSPWMGLASVVRAADGRPLVVPKVTADTTTYIPGEGTAITESTPTLANGTATLTAYKALSYVSAEALEDVEYDLEDVIARSAARSIALAAGSDFTTAILAGINNGGTATGTPFFAFDDLIGLGYGRAAPYREAGAWVMSNSAISKTRKFKDSQNQYLWQPSGIAGQPDALLGSAVFEDPYLAAVGSASKSVAFGDWRSALLIKATDIRVDVSREFKFDTDQVAFKTVLRAGLVVQDPAAAAFMVSANS